METKIKEIWRDVFDYEGYKVSNLGNVKSPKGILLKTHLRRNYLSVALCKKSKHKHFSVHRLVATTFISNPLNKDTVNHIDCNKMNNNVLNLEWATTTENRRHAVRAGKHFEIDKLITKERMDIVYDMRRQGYKQHEIAKELNVTQSVISRVISQGRGYKNVYDEVVI